MDSSKQAKLLKKLEKMNDYDKLKKYLSELAGTDGFFCMAYYNHNAFTHLLTFGFAFSADPLAKQANRLIKILGNVQAHENIIQSTLASLCTKSGVAFGMLNTFLSQTRANIIETSKNLVQRFILFDWGNWRDMQNKADETNAAYIAFNRIAQGITKKIDALEKVLGDYSTIYADLSELLDNNTGARHKAAEDAMQELLAFTKQLIS